MRCKIIWSLWAFPCRFSKAAFLCVFCTTKVSFPLVTGAISLVVNHWADIYVVQSRAASPFPFGVAYHSGEMLCLFGSAFTHKKKSFGTQFSARDWSCRGGGEKECDKNIWKKLTTLISLNLESPRRQRFIKNIYLTQYRKWMLPSSDSRGRVPCFNLKVMKTGLLQSLSHFQYSSAKPHFKQSATFALFFF